LVIRLALAYLAPATSNCSAASVAALGAKSHLISLGHAKEAPQAVIDRL
jgi:hypothetical protein